MTRPLACSYSTIECKELVEKTLPQYCISDPLDCLFWERGANDTYKVQCADATYFLRIYRCGAFSLDANKFEAEALHYLHQQGFPVAHPIALKSGGFISQIDAAEGIRHTLLTAKVTGEPPDYESLDNCQLVGSSVAQMHLAFADFKSFYKRADLDTSWLLEQSMAEIRNHMAQHPDALKLIEDTAKKVRAIVQSVPTGAPDRGICHGDLHGGNLHISQGTVTHFDFEECAYGYRAYDLATFKWGVCMGEGGRQRWAAFLKGYLSLRSISDADLSSIDAFVAMREIAESAYGVRHVGDFGHNAIMVSDIDDVSRRFKKLLAALS